MYRVDIDVVMFKFNIRCYLIWIRGQLYLSTVTLKVCCT